MNLNGKKIVFAALICALFCSGVVISLNYGAQIGFTHGYNQGYVIGFGTGNLTGYVQGFERGVQVTSDFIETSYGIQVKVDKTENGSYVFTASMPDGKVTFSLQLHVQVDHYRNGVLLSRSNHAMTLTNHGTNWTAHKISGGSAAGWENWERNATWISMSNSSQTVSAAWTILPDEITTDGLDRQEGSFTVTGIGAWNLTKQFTATGSNSTKMYGLNLGDKDGTYDNTLIAAEQQGQGNQKNLLANDQLTVTIQGSVSQS